MISRTLVRSSVVLALAVVASSAFGQVATSQEEALSPAEATARGNARDEAAGADAINGWWTEALKNRDERLAWWRDARFGCFIHWGVYSALGGEYNGQRG